MEGAATPAQSCDCNYFVLQVLDQIASHFIPRGTQENPIIHPRHELHRGILGPLQTESDLRVAVWDSGVGSSYHFQGEN